MQNQTAIDYSGIVKLLRLCHPINTSSLSSYGTVSTFSFKSSEFTLCCELESLSLNKSMIAFWQTRQSLEQKGINGINGLTFGLKWGCYAAESIEGQINIWHRAQSAGKFASVERFVTWLVKSMTPGLIGKAPSVNRWKNSRLSNDLRPNWSKEWHLH